MLASLEGTVARRITIIQGHPDPRPDHFGHALADAYASGAEQADHTCKRIDVAALDWLGNGDHDNGHNREYTWWLIQKTTDAFEIPGSFTTVFSYERSVPFPEGHRNVVFTERGVRPLPRLPLSDRADARPAPDTLPASMRAVSRASVSPPGVLCRYSAHSPPISRPRSRIASANARASPSGGMRQTAALRRHISAKPGRPRISRMGPSPITASS